MVFELELGRDLVEHLHTARLEHVVEVAQLVGVGLEIGERGEDLAGRDEATLTYLAEHAGDAAAVGAFTVLGRGTRHDRRALGDHDRACRGVDHDRDFGRFDDAFGLAFEGGPSVRLRNLRHR